MSAQESTGWTGRIASAEDEARLAEGKPPVIAEAHVYVYGWEQGASEVQVRFPDEAKPGATNAAANQARLKALLTRELADAVDMLSES